MVGRLRSARILATRSYHSRARSRAIGSIHKRPVDPAANSWLTFTPGKDLGVLTAHPTDDARKPEWNAKAKRRSELQQEYFEQADTLLTASIAKRSGPQRALRPFTRPGTTQEVAYRTKRLSP